jgi:hypothetical protein
MASLSCLGLLSQVRDNVSKVHDSGRFLGIVYQISMGLARSLSSRRDLVLKYTLIDHPESKPNLRRSSHWFGFMTSIQTGTGAD